MGLKVKYGVASGFEFAQVFGKLVNTPTQNHRANAIRKMTNALNKGKLQMKEEYEKEVMGVFAQKDDQGKIVMDESDPNAFKCIEGKEEEMKKFMDTFGNREIELDVAPLTPDTLADIKMTAKELDILGDLFTDAGFDGTPVGSVGRGPGVPNLQVQK